LVLDCLFMNREKGVFEKVFLCEYHSECRIYKGVVRKRMQGDDSSLLRLLKSSCGCPKYRSDCGEYNRFEREHII